MIIIHFLQSICNNTKSEQQFPSYIMKVPAISKIFLSVEDGPITVFAPTNTTLQNVELPSDNNERAAVLKYHVVKGKSLNTKTIADQTNSTIRYLEESYQGAKTRFNQYDGQTVNINVK